MIKIKNLCILTIVTSINYMMGNVSNNFIKRYNEDTNTGYLLEVDVQYPEKLHELHNDLPFFLKQ